MEHATGHAPSGKPPKAKTAVGNKKGDHDKH
jgi:hypothetical protein